MTIIDIANIPQEIKDELTEHYKSVSYKNYGDAITEQCVIRKAKYIHILQENVIATILNIVTFQQEIIKDVNIVESYLVRGEFNEDSADIYAVITTGPMSARP